MDFRIERVAVGVRFKMSRFGAIQCPSLADRVGIVLELSPSNTMSPCCSMVTEGQPVCTGTTYLRHPSGNEGTSGYCCGLIIPRGAQLKCSPRPDRV